MGLRRRPTLAAAIVYALLSLLMFAPALLPGHTLSASDYLYSAAPWIPDRPESVRPLGANPELADSVQVFQPFLAHTRASLPTLPLWNPHISGGRPFLADQQSAIFSPFSLPAYIFGFWWSLGLIAALKVFAAAFGTYLLGRALGLRFGGALLAGVVFGFALFMLAWMSWPLTNVFPLIPWLFLLTERVIRRPGPLPFAALAGVVALQYFGGHPESSFHAMAATLAFFALRLVVARRAGELTALRPVLLSWGGAVVAGTLVAAVTLIPLIELLLHSGDLEQREGLPAAIVQRKYALAALLPDYWGRPTGTALEGFLIERAFYVGALPLLLAAWAVIARPALERVGVAVIGVASMALVFGISPVAPFLRLFPGFATAHNTRLTIVWVLCVALLAGWGLDELAARRPAGRRAAALAASAAALFTLPIVVMAARGELVLRLLGQGLEQGWGFVTPPLPPLPPDGVISIRLGTLLVWLTFMAGASVLVWLRARGRLGPTAWIALAVVLVAADLFRTGMGQTPALETAEATQPPTGAIRHLQARRPARFVGLNSVGGVAAMPVNVAMRWGLYDARGYDFPVERRYRRLWRRAVSEGLPPLAEPTQIAVANERSLRAFNLLSVSDVLQDPADPPLRLPGLQLAYDRPDARIYSNAGALPRAFVVGGQDVVARQDDQLSAVLAPDWNGRRTVVTSARLPGLSSGPQPPAGTARLTRNDDDRVTISATASRPAELVLTDTSFPGWTARLDGRDVPLHRVDYLLRGVSLPPGRHTVEMRYEPTSFRLGWIVSLLALVGLAITTALGVRAAGPTALARRRRGRAAPRP